MKPRFGMDSSQPRTKRFGLEEDTGQKKRKSKAQEDKIAKRGGGQRVPASGAMPGKPGDVRGVSRFLIEAKRTDGIGIYLSDKKLIKAEDEAASQGCVPAIHFELGGRKNGRNGWVMIPEDVFYAMIELIGAEHEKWA